MTEIRRWWRVVVSDVMGTTMWDGARSREEALRQAEAEDKGRVGWPASRVIEFTERGREHDSEYIR